MEIFLGRTLYFFSNNWDGSNPVLISKPLQAIINLVFFEKEYFDKIFDTADVGTAIIDKDSPSKLLKLEVKLIFSGIL